MRWLRLGRTPPDLDRPAVWLARGEDSFWRETIDALRPDATDLADAALFAAADRAAERLARRLLLKALVGRALGIAPGGVVVERSPAGALAVTAPERLCVSLSTRAGWTMVGMSRSPIGVDVELSAPAAPLPLDMLCAGEAEALAAQAEGLRPALFARYWAVKEATLKAAGLGLRRDPATICVRFEGDHAEACADGHVLAWAEVREAGPGVAVVASLA